MYNFYQQADHRAIGVPLQCPLIIDYQSAGVNNNHTPVLQQPFTPRMKVSDWGCQQVCSFLFFRIFLVLVQEQECHFLNLVDDLEFTGKRES